MLGEEAVIAEPNLLKPYETDGLSAYRQVPLAVVLANRTIGSVPEKEPSLSRGGIAEWDWDDWDDEEEDEDDDFDVGGA